MVVVMLVVIFLLSVVIKLSFGKLQLNTYKINCVQQSIFSLLCSLHVSLYIVRKNSCCNA
jgi:hypothetical protein